MIKEEINFIEKTKEQDRKELENLSVEEIVKKTLENWKIDIREYEVEIAVILKKYNLEIKMNTEKRKNSLIQIVLNQINPNNNLEIDWIIWEKSKKAILNFQKNFNKNNLDKLNENWVLDKKTEKAIFNYFRNFENNLPEEKKYLEDNKKTKNKNQEADEQFKRILKQKAKEDWFDYDGFIKENNITFENNNEEDNFYKIIKEKSKEDWFNYNDFLKENNITNEDIEKYNKNSNSENDDYIDINSLEIRKKENLDSIYIWLLESIDYYIKELKLDKNDYRYKEFLKISNIIKKENWILKDEIKERIWNLQDILHFDYKEKIWDSEESYSKNFKNQNLWKNQIENNNFSENSIPWQIKNLDKKLPEKNYIDTNNISSQDLINQASVDLKQNNKINPQIPNNFIGQNINQKISNNNFNPNDYYQNWLRIQKSWNNLTISDWKWATTSISWPWTVCMNWKCYSN